VFVKRFKKDKNLSLNVSGFHPIIFEEGAFNICFNFKTERAKEYFSYSSDGISILAEMINNIFKFSHQTHKRL
jgi:hypothetical protein